jgi:hypothetical protein
MGCNFIFYLLFIYFCDYGIEKKNNSKKMQIQKDNSSFPFTWESIKQIPLWITIVISKDNL